MIPQIEAYLVVSGTDGFLPEELEVRYGLRADRVWHAGELVERTTMRRKHNAWLLCGGICETWSLTEGMRPLWDKVRPVEHQLHDMIAHEPVEVQLSIVVYLDDRAPDLNIDRATVAMLASLNADVDIDAIFIAGE